MKLYLLDLAIGPYEPGEGDITATAGPSFLVYVLLLLGLVLIVGTVIFFAVRAAKKIKMDVEG